VPSTPLLPPQDNNMAAQTPLRVGLIGAGANTKLRHLPGLRDNEGVTVTHVVNRSPESSAAAAAALEIPNVAASWKELVNSPDIDAVCIGTWPYTHAEMTIAALKAGKHVLCEARMAMNAAEAKEMVAAANAHPKLVAQIVPSPMTLKYDKTIRNLIDSGALGQLLSIDVRGAGSAFMDTKAGMHWREDRDLSGNNIMAMGIFYEALMRWVGGATSVFAMGTVNVKERDGKAISIPDHVDILAAMACGAQARFQFSSVTGLAESAKGFWLYGTEGTIHLDILAKSLRFGKKGNALAEVAIAPEDSAGWRVEHEFVGAIRGTEEVKLTDFSTGLKYMAFTDAVAESLKEGKVVAV